MTCYYLNVHFQDQRVNELDRFSGESALISNTGLPVFPREKPKFLIEGRFMLDSFYHVVWCCIKVDFEGYYMCVCVCVCVCV